MTKVLLVEDDNNLREIYEARLAAEGYEISTAKDGEDALAVAKQVKPELIISDVMMPRISGFEMLDILRNTDGLKHVKVIMLTALGQNDDKTRADNLGADRYLVKSQVTLEDIVKAADELLNPDSEQPALGAVGAEQSEPPEDTSPTAPDVSDGSVPAPAETASTTPTDVEQQPIPAQPQPAEAPTVPEPEMTPSPEQATPVAAPDPVQAEPPTPDNNQQPAQPTPDPAIAVQPEPPAGTDNVSSTEADNSNSDGSDADEPLIQMPPQPDIAAAAATATADSAATTAQESATVAQQIEDFANTPAPVMPEQATPAPENSSPQPADTPPTPDIPTEQATPEQTQPPTPGAAAAVSNNDSVIQEAVDNLANPEAPATPEVSTETPQATNESGQIAGKKVIRPISQPETETAQLETLLAQEQMQEDLNKGTTGEPIVGSNEGTPPAPVVATPTPAPSTPPTEQPAPPAQPQAIDSPNMTVQPEPGGVFMPNQNGSANEDAL